MILLERSLLVLDDGVIEGRKVFSNIVKYLQSLSTASTEQTHRSIGCRLRRHAWR